MTGRFAERMRDKKVRADTRIVAGLAALDVARLRDPGHQACARSEEVGVADGPARRTRGRGGWKHGRRRAVAA